MAKPTREKYPTLAKAWDDYGHTVKFEDLVDMKVATTHHYVALMWMDNDDYCEYAELYSVDNGATWEFIQDGTEPIPVKVWRKAKVVPDCDHLDIDWDKIEEK